MKITIGGVPVSGEAGDIALVLEQIIYNMGSYYGGRD